MFLYSACALQLSESVYISVSERHKSRILCPYLRATAFCLHNKAFLGREYQPIPKQQRHVTQHRCDLVTPAGVKSRSPEVASDHFVELVVN